ncbi:MAG TPA: hypothetical protein VET30_08570 [Pseudoxanthomonas sp.]|nr:hypothetical protein [Pseudoxanthomonas sp.]
MKRLALFTILVGMAFAAVAQTAAPEPARPAPQPNATAVGPDTVGGSKNDLADRNCLRETGSRVIRADRKGRKCAIASGRSYDRRDIDQTGATDLKDALRRLDPAVH